MLRIIFLLAFALSACAQQDAPRILNPQPVFNKMGDIIGCEGSGETVDIDGVTHCAYPGDGGTELCYSPAPGVPPYPCPEDQDTGCFSPGSGLPIPCSTNEDDNDNFEII